MRPTEILDAQADLLDKLQYKPMFRAHQALAATNALGLTSFARLQRANLEHGKEVVGGEAWVLSLTQHVRAAYAYRVTPDMCTLLEHAASALDESDTFDRELAPTGCGIVRFERPIRVTDARGKEMLIHWAVWGPVSVRHKPGLAFTFFNDAWTEPDTGYADYQEWLKATGNETGDSPERERVIYEEAMRTVGRWMSAHQTAIGNGESLGPSMVEADPQQQAIIVAQNAEPHPATNLFRYMHALFALLNQTIVKTEEEYPDRHGRKRAIKAGLPPKVTVITLRRTEDNARREGESLVEWSHRWIVRQHWRWQPYGPRKSDHEHDYGPAITEAGYRVRHCTHFGCENRLARIIIPAAVKGPPEAPLIVSNKLYNLER